MWPRDTSTSQTDGRTTCHGNTVLFVASRGKNRCSWRRRPWKKCRRADWPTAFNRWESFDSRLPVRWALATTHVVLMASGRSHRTIDPADSGTEWSRGCAAEWHVAVLLSPLLIIIVLWYAKLWTLSFEVGDEEKQKNVIVLKCI